MGKSNTVNELHFIYRQKGKLPEKGVLTATANCGIKKTVLLIDSFTITGEIRRTRFIRKLYNTSLLKKKDYPAEVVAQCLLEMAADALFWNEPSVEKAKPQSDKVLNQLDFEKLLANIHNPPPCYLVRTVYPENKTMRSNS